MHTNDFPKTISSLSPCPNPPLRSAYRLQNKDAHLLRKKRDRHATGTKKQLTNKNVGGVKEKKVEKNE